MRTFDRPLTPALGVRASVTAQMVVVEGNAAAGQKFRLDGSVTLGRSPDATIVLDDPEISRLHARVTRTESGGYRIEDLGSKNGTFVNGVRVEHKVLTYGDRVRVGPRATLELSSFDAVEDHLVQRQRFEAIGRLGVGIAHDLNNVLAALQAGAAFLRGLSPERTLGEPEVSECISDLTLAAERATGLTSGILAFARGRRAVRGPVDLSALGWEVVRMLRHTLDQSIQIEPVIAPQVIVHGNQSELHQVLLNLCLNARDAMRDGGMLRIGVSLTRPSPELGFASDDLVAWLSVADTGSGMEPNVIARIFEPFFTTKGEGAGYGLGLATVREIVSLHGGHISIDSTPGEGSTFNVYLPRIEPDTARPPPPTAESRQMAAAREPEARQATVLLVDDERMVRRSVARLLRQAGFDVTEAADGVEAIAQYQQSRFDLVLLDLDMPGMNGEETQAELMVLDPEVRVIFATGHSDPEREAAVRARGALAFLQKPFSLDMLLLIVREVLEPGAIDPFEDELTRPK
jgi:signal transduction histidine kinase/ActR/RegA family two-component response regulator